MTTTTKTANGAAAADATTDGATTKKRGPAASLPAREEGHAGDWRDFRPALKDKLASAACWATGSSWLTACVSAMIPAHKLVGAPKIDWFSRFFCRGLVKTATWSSWRSVVHPAVSEDEQYIFAQNHINHFDFVSMYPATRHYKQGLELETHFRYPVYGPFMESRGTIPVPAERSERLPAIKKHIASEVAAGRSIPAFPEGTRTLNGRVGDFRKGVFVIARDLGLKVAPTAVTGMYCAMRKGSLLIRPGQEITVYIDEPVDFAGVSDEELPAKVEEVRSAIARRVDAYFESKYGA